MIDDIYRAVDELDDVVKASRCRHIDITCFHLGTGYIVDDVEDMQVHLIEQQCKLRFAKLPPADVCEECGCSRDVCAENRDEGE